MSVVLQKNRLSVYHSERMRAIERLRRHEWTFDRHPTADNAKALREERLRICEIEDKIVTAYNMGKALAILAGQDDTP